VLWNKKILILAGIILPLGALCTFGFYKVTPKGPGKSGSPSAFDTSELGHLDLVTGKLPQDSNYQTGNASELIGGFSNAIQANLLEMEKNQPWNLAELDEAQIMSLLKMEEKTLAIHKRAEQVLENADRGDILQKIRVLKSISMQRIALLSANLNK